MEFIRNVVALIDQDSFEAEIQNSKKLLKFFRLIRSDQNIETKDLQKSLFYSDQSKQAFKQLKLRLHKKLTEYLLKHGIKNGHQDSYAQNRRVCMNLVTTATYLGNVNARTVAAYVAETAVMKTIKNEFTDLTVMLASHLYSYYSSSRFNSRKQIKYDRMLSTYKDLYTRELELAKKHSELQSYFSRSASGMHERILPLAITYADTAQSYLRSIPISAKLIFSAFLIILIRFEMERNYEKMLEVSSEACNLIKRREVKNDLMLYMFELRKLICYIRLERHDEVDIIARKYDSQLRSGSQNWFVMKMYHSLSKIHSRNYSEALEILKDVQKDKNFNKLSSAVLQTWRVIDAYMEFLISIGRIKGNELSSFRLNRFLNDQTIFSKDKRGLNIAILTIQFLFLLQQRKYSQIIDRAEALKQYCYRYLRKDDTFRSHCFIRMLLMIPKADFNRIRTERYADPYLTKLRSVPLRISEQTIEVEVIPYEDLWQMTLDLLD